VPAVVKGDRLELDVLRRRMEYPELKRAVREQYARFQPSVVLIEDKASGTQLIQELVAEGLQGSPAISGNQTRSCACTRRPR
jgi:phage terminase large subunit-like protein